MPLKNSQYDLLMREYNRKQLQNENNRSAAINHAYSLSPRLQTVDEDINATYASLARSKITGDVSHIDAYKKKLNELKGEKVAILLSLSLPSDYMELHYTCNDCKDTGYIGNKKCHCFYQAAVNLLYTQSNIKDILLRENFDTLTFDYYSTQIHPMLNKSIASYMEEIVTYCKDYVSNFSTKKESILFTGTTGVGKTFLSNCIAKALIDNCYSVVYFTATELFDVFSKNTYSKDEISDEDIDQYILDSDLLIIDDLGTELSNAFTTSKFFYCINERLVRQKATIVSTNLKATELRDIYSERVASRILSSYHIISLFGDDIRIRKKFGQ